MNIKSIRRQNLLKLIEERFEGNKAAFARAIDRPAPNVHRMLIDVETVPVEKGKKDNRGIGEKLARDIEGKLGLGPLWLDQANPHETMALSQDEAVFIEKIKREIETRQVPDHMRETILAILGSSPQKK